MILETSIQARFLIPMALSLGFGVLFATFIILLLVPAFYLIVEDARGLLGRGLDAVFPGRKEVEPEPGVVKPEGLRLTAGSGRHYTAMDD